MGLLDDCKRKKVVRRSQCSVQQGWISPVQRFKRHVFAFRSYAKLWIFHYPPLSLSLFRDQADLLLFSSYALFSFPSSSLRVSLRFNHPPRSSIIICFCTPSISFEPSLWWFFTIFRFVGFFQKLMMFERIFSYLLFFYIGEIYSFFSQE